MLFSRDSHRAWGLPVKSWLDPLHGVLDESPHPVDFFFHDDDPGWGDNRLSALLNVFADHPMPIDCQPSGRGARG